MTHTQRRRRKQAYTLVELLVGVLIVEIITAVALPAYINEVYASRMGIANANAKALATAIQGKAITLGSYDTTLTDYATDMGGTIPVNPCSGTTTGYAIATTGNQCTVSATAGTSCGTWTPVIYTLGYSGD